MAADVRTAHKDVLGESVFWGKVVLVCECLEKRGGYDKLILCQMLINLVLFGNRYALGEKQ
jgi:hypothetical protein